MPETYSNKQHFRYITLKCSHLKNTNVIITKLCRVLEIWLLEVAEHPHTPSCLIHPRNFILKHVCFKDCEKGYLL